MPLVFSQAVLPFMKPYEPAAPPPVVTGVLAQTDYRIPSSWGTISSVNIGAADANRVIFVSAITFATTADYDLTASAGSVTKIGTATHSDNAGRATWWSITGVTTGTTINLTKSGTAASTAHVCVFRSIGYEAEGSTPILVDSEAGSDVLQASVAPSIDASGAFLAHGGRYTGIIGPAGTVAGGISTSPTTNNRSWAVFQDAVGGTRTVSASAAAAVGRKCLSVLRLQDIP